MRELAIALLDDEHGISDKAWDLLQVMLFAESGNEDILAMIKATDGRWYLPTNWTSRYKME